MARIRTLCSVSLGNLLIYSCKDGKIWPQQRITYYYYISWNNIEESMIYDKLPSKFQKTFSWFWYCQKIRTLLFNTKWPKFNFKEINPLHYSTVAELNTVCQQYSLCEKKNSMQLDPRNFECSNKMTWKLYAGGPYEKGISQCNISARQRNSGCGYELARQKNNSLVTLF